MRRGGAPTAWNIGAKSSFVLESICESHEKLTLDTRRDLISTLKLPDVVLHPEYDYSRQQGDFVVKSIFGTPEKPV